MASSLLPGVSRLLRCLSRAPIRVRSRSFETTQVRVGARLTGVWMRTSQEEAMPEWESRRAGLLERDEEALARHLAAEFQPTTRCVAQVG